MASTHSTSVKRIFISSTFQELGEHRLAVVDAVRRLDLDVGVPEVLSARPGAPLAHCLELVGQCDALIVLAGLQLGSVPSVELGGDGARSYTWLEVDRALEMGIPVFAFISEEATSAYDCPARNFHDWLCDRFLIGTFTDPQSAAIGAAVAIARHCMHPTQTAPTHYGIAAAHSLPPPQTLLGRDREVEQLDEWFETPNSDTHVLRIAGVGGCGKSALIATWINRRRQEFESRGSLTFIWSFAERSDTVAFFRALSAALLGRSPLDGRERLAVVADQLGRGGDHLIVLDGLDRVRGQGIPDPTGDGERLDELISSIGNGLGNCRLLVTTRRLSPLTEGETAVRLGPLPYDAATELLEPARTVLDQAGIDHCLEATGRHALSLRAIASLIRHFGTRELDPKLLSLVPPSEDHSPSALAQVLAEYTQSISTAQRDLLSIICAFPLGLPFRAGSSSPGDDGVLSTAVSNNTSTQRIAMAAEQLLSAGVVEERQYRDAVLLAPQPFVRNWFRPMVGCSDQEIASRLDQLLGRSFDHGLETDFSDHGMSFLVRQLAKPDADLVAASTAWWFNLVNYDANLSAVEALGRLDGQRVLDIGFGGGIGLRALLSASEAVVVDGVEASEQMVRIACDTFSNDLKLGRLGLQHCEVGRSFLAFPAGTFDAVLSVCTIPFWSNVYATLAEIRRVLKVGGVLKLAVESYRIEYMLTFPRLGYPTLAEGEVVGLLAGAGFADIGVSLVNGLGGSCTLVSAKKPA